MFWNAIRLEEKEVKKVKEKNLPVFREVNKQWKWELPWTANLICVKYDCETL